jgi:peptidoglycan/xylan/chitin deacetylase (PgdA/CDA1 family)
MEYLTTHTLTDFWKIPAGLVAFNDSRIDAIKGSITVSMPAKETKTKPSLYQWENAFLYAPITGFNPELNDITAEIHVDPISRSVSLPFNIDRAVMNLLTEKYIDEESNHSLFILGRRFYYKIKPILPRFIQVWIRQNAVARMSNKSFPSWEIDTSVDLLHRNLLTKLLEANPGSSLPMISFWPRGATICLVLTHDIETHLGLENIKKITNIEQKKGFRSVWNFVPEKYPVDLKLLRELQDSGFEVGVHGLTHDGRLFDSYKIFTRRAAKINDYLNKWGGVGFRSESNLRNLDWISEHIKVEYDSSCVSSEWYGAQPGGSCTTFPFIYRNLVELPLTLQQDFTLLDILKLSPEDTLNHWIQTVELIKALNGLVLICVHPDYMNSPERLRMYEQFLEFIQGEHNCWHALPKEVASWWIDRNNSELLQSDNGWHISGSASDCGVVMNLSLHGGKLCILPS